MLNIVILMGFRSSLSSVKMFIIFYAEWPSNVSSSSYYFINRSDVVYGQTGVIH